MTTRTEVPRATRMGRLADYVVEMFPPWIYGPLSIALFGSVYLSLQALGGQEMLSISWRAGLGVLTLALMLLLFRVYDELMDFEKDVRLAGAGDPNYVGRTVVTGRVTKADLTFLRWLVTAVVVAINLPIGYPLPALAFAVMFALVWLSFRRFFWPAVGNNLLLVLLTDSPVMLSIAGYAMAIYLHQFGHQGVGPEALLALGTVWLPIGAWETSRKIRAKEDETDYQTYTKLLGETVAPLLPAAFAIGSTACLMALASLIDVNWVYRGILLAATAFCVGLCVRFWLKPSTRTARLRPYFEAYILIALIGFVASMVLDFGVELGP